MASLTLYSTERITRNSEIPSQNDLQDGRVLVCVTSVFITQKYFLLTSVTNVLGLFFVDGDSGKEKSLHSRLKFRNPAKDHFWIFLDVKNISISGDEKRVSSCHSG